ncbi:AMP-binding protein [Paenibacillus massiliensis]|uniref:AMP-binding protein n=1 Tax=Paenibacillus massiliensis TaxID=225917 RepID=UPI00046F5A7A|nr:AMP-binding protein [Paenibacillus massiliensis]
MFFDIQPHGEQYAVITEQYKITYAELQALADQYHFRSGEKELVLLLCDNEMEVVAAYLAALQAKQAVMLLNASTNTELLQEIVMTYRPKWIVVSNELDFDGYHQHGRVLERTHHTTTTIHAELAVLLSTSGTTGSHKFVRLSYSNLQSNAEAIVEYLEINADERGILNLPLSYSYGLSILNSHFQAGATVLLTGESVVAKPFWNFVQERQATSLPGVPFTYQMLQRVGFFKMELPHLRTLTQAGGRLEERLVRLFGEYAKEQGKRFFVMYGQTEAAPRISYIPSDEVLNKPGSIGIPIPGGRLELASDTGELVYYGNNVMLGYAESLSDLEKGNECGGVLYTGDTATVDEEGFFTITGRMKRFIKLFGLRINLDEVERKLEALLQQPVACIGSDDRMLVATESSQDVAKIKHQIDQLYKLHPTAYRVIVVDEIPRMANGKINYQVLKGE